MREAFLFCFESQGDRPKIAMEKPITLMESRVEYKYKNEWDVVGVDSKESSEPSTKFVNLPRVKMTTSSHVAERKSLE